MKFRMKQKDTPLALSKEVFAHRFVEAYPHEGTITGWVNKKSGKLIKGEPKSKKNAEKAFVFNGEVVKDGDYIIIEQDGTSYVVSSKEFNERFVIA